MKNKVLTAVLGISVFFLIITVSIGLPIYLRFFYYAQIKSLGIESSTGYSYAQIKQAYDQVLNYLTLPFTEFGTGILSYSEEGAAHFADCKVLFNLNAGVMFVSAAIVIVIAVLNKKKVVSLCRPKGFSVCFYSALAAIILPVIIGGLAAINFDKAFVIFHKIFFPGKDNWLFDPSVDEIIQILPQEYFMNCAIFIGAGLIFISVALITVSAVMRHKRLTRDAAEESAGQNASRTEE